MHLDVVDLKNFYYRTGLGRAAQRAVRDQVLKFWPQASGQGQTMVGFGFAVPLMRPYLGTARRVIGLMPGQQGVMPWPAGMANVSVLCQETLWPLETGHVDRLLVMHGLETSDHAAAVLEESARVLGPGGRALFIVPNRAGLWSRSDSTPFGYGRPYSLAQLEIQLKKHAFVPERHAAVLYQPPSHHRFWLRSGPVWEKVGRKISSGIGAGFAGGVLMLEVSKQVYAPGGREPARRMRRPLRVLDAITGEPKPATRGL